MAKKDNRSSKPHIRVFPHIQDEFPTIDSLAIWLAIAVKAGGGIYLVRERKAIDQLPCGSIVLFLHINTIVGEAVVIDFKHGSYPGRVQATGEKFVYGARTKFSPTSIRLYSPEIPIESIQPLIGDHPNRIVPHYCIIPDWGFYPKLLGLHTSEPRNGTFF